VSLPWAERIAPEERTWFALYEPREERRLRLGAFEEATVRASHVWAACDLANEFPRWMGAQEHQESYFTSPEDLTDDLLDGFAEHAAGWSGVPSAGRRQGRRV
jgi:hypothetical protein